MKLYEISGQLALIDAALEAAEGEITPETEAALNQLEGELEAKVDGIIALIRQREAMMDALKKEVSRLQGRASSCGKGIDSLKKYLMGGLKLAGKPKVKTTLNTVSVVKGREQIVVDDIESLPENLLTFQPPTANKALIKKHLDSGEVIKGVHVETGDDYLLIR